MRSKAEDSRISGAGETSEADMKLSVVIPVYNERNTVARVIARARGLGHPPATARMQAGHSDFQREIVVVEDGSTDGTRAILADLRNEADTVIVFHERNLGKGVANALYASSLTDMETCYKLFTREVAGKLDLRARRWGFDPEIAVQILRLGYTIHEVPIAYRARLTTEGKESRWRDGLTVLKTLIGCRLVQESKEKSQKVRTFVSTSTDSPRMSYEEAVVIVAGAR